MLRKEIGLDSKFLKGFFVGKDRVCSFLCTACHYPPDCALVAVGTDECLVTELKKGIAFG